MEAGFQLALDSAPFLLKGAYYTVILSLGGMFFGLLLGFGLALMVEALTQGLSGYGRRDVPTRWGASVYLQLIDPAAFAGAGEAMAQMDYLAEQCHANAPIDANQPVRLPGEQATRNIELHRRDGVPVSSQTVAALRDWSRKLGVNASALD